LLATEGNENAEKKPQVITNGNQAPQQPAKGEKHE
jgi:hypothetical protein